MKKVFLVIFIIFLSGIDNVNAQAKTNIQNQSSKTHRISKNFNKIKSNSVIKSKPYIKTVSKSNQAQHYKKNVVSKKIPLNSNLNTNDRLAIYAVDASTGKVLFAKKAYEVRYPASLTKLMTLYILFEKLDQNSISFNDNIKFSKYASSKPASKLGIEAGKTISVREAVDALIVLSANDVATAVGEYIGGSEGNFSRIMNAKAQQLRMYNTHFSNASGLFHPAQHTTAADMVRLGIALRNDFPQYYKFFSKTNFNFRGRLINGHNSITKTYDGAEGLKTGYISQSGYNLVSSASRNKTTIFATVLGGKTASQRDLYMKKLLDASFSKIDKNRERL